jgi:hypothetical protein
VVLEEQYIRKSNFSGSSDQFAIANVTGVRCWLVLCVYFIVQIN